MISIEMTRERHVVLTFSEGLPPKRPFTRMTMEFCGFRLDLICDPAITCERIVLLDPKIADRLYPGDPPRYP